jgi:Domain of unknown function (DUF1707)
MAGPGDEVVAGMRASHADREQVIEMLKAAFVQGRLAKGEFDLRVGQALASRTYAELAALTIDIPAPRPRRPHWTPVRTLACVTTGAVSLFALPFVVEVLTDGRPPAAQTVIFLVVMFTAFCVPLAAVLLRARFGKRHRPPTRPAPDATGPDATGPDATGTDAAAPCPAMMGR